MESITLNLWRIYIHVFHFLHQLQNATSWDSEGGQTIDKNHATACRGRRVWEVHSGSDHSASMAQILQVKVNKCQNNLVRVNVNSSKELTWEFIQKNWSMLWFFTIIIKSAINREANDKRIFMKGYLSNWFLGHNSVLNLTQYFNSLLQYLSPLLLALDWCTHLCSLKFNISQKKCNQLNNKSYFQFMHCISIEWWMGLGHLVQTPIIDSAF